MEKEINEPQPVYKRSGYITPEEYFKMDEASEERLEYFDGEVFPVNYDIIDNEIVFQGASFNHEDIVANCVREIGNLLKGKNCRIRASSLRTSPTQFKSYVYPDATITCGDTETAKGIFDTLTNPTVIIEVISKSSTPGKKSYTYPDAVIVCGKPEMEDSTFDTLKNPTVIIEVISKSTENYKRRRKMLFYIQIPSLQEYVMINSIDVYEVTVCRRAENEAWTFQQYTLLEENVEFKSVGISISMAELYENVTFETKEEF